MKTSVAPATNLTSRTDLYDLDFFEWTLQTANRLRHRRFAEVDVARVA
jgi:hypothetical protein